MTDAQTTYDQATSAYDKDHERALIEAITRTIFETPAVSDADRCPQVTFVFGAAGSSTLSVDSIVGGMPVGAGGSGFSVSRSASRPIPRIAPAPAVRGGGDK